MSTGEPTFLPEQPTRVGQLCVFGEIARFRVRDAVGVLAHYAAVQLLLCPFVAVLWDVLILIL